MALTKQERILERLRDFQNTTPDVLGAAVVENSGLIIASTLTTRSQEERVAAMSAVIQSLNERLAQELDQGEPQQLYLRSEHGYILLSSLGKEAVFTVLAKGTAMIGLVLLAMRQAGPELQSLIESRQPEEAG